MLVVIHVLSASGTTPPCARITIGSTALAMRPAIEASKNAYGAYPRYPFPVFRTSVYRSTAWNGFLFPAMLACLAELGFVNSHVFMAFVTHADAFALSF